jgi:uncharacterized pyridoxamine 5'-phosphate oxidase family protein
MSYGSEALKREAWGWLKPVQLIHLATWDGTMPRVRPVSLVFEEERFWVATGTREAKAVQIAGNPAFEFSLTLQGEGSSGTFRGSGLARLVDDIEEKRRIAAKIPFFGEYWESPEQESFCLIELGVSEVEFMRPHEMTAVKFRV